VLQAKKRLSFALLPCRKKKRVAERRERENEESRTAAAGHTFVS
jgi:hypothetical protein